MRFAKKKKQAQEKQEIRFTEVIHKNNRLELIKELRDDNNRGIMDTRQTIDQTIMDAG